MLRYILWRIAVMIPTLLIISALVFTIIELPPGDYFESYIASETSSGVDCILLAVEEGYDNEPESDRSLADVPVATDIWNTVTVHVFRRP